MHHRELLCYFVWGREEKSSHIVLLTTVTVKRKPGVKCPHWIPPKRLKHIKMALCVQGPSLGANIASKALYKSLTRRNFQLPLLRISVRLSTEAM